MSSEPEAWGPRLAIALRAIRKARGLSAAQVAALMGMDRRNYANFEAGRGRLNLARVVGFAQVTDSDVWAILAAVLLDAPQLALGAADNKMLLAFYILLGEFVSQFGGRMRLLDTAEVIAAFSGAFKSLGSCVDEKETRLSADWLREGAARLGLVTPTELNEEESS